MFTEFFHYTEAKKDKITCTYRLPLLLHCFDAGAWATGRATCLFTCGNQPALRGVTPKKWVS